MHHLDVFSPQTKSMGLEWTSVQYAVPKDGQYLQNENSNKQFTHIKTGSRKLFFLQDWKYLTVQCYLNPPHPVRSLNDDFRKAGNDQKEKKNTK